MAPQDSMNDNTPAPVETPINKPTEIANKPDKTAVLQDSQTSLNQLKQTVNPDVEKNIESIRQNFSIEKARQVIHDIEGIDPEKYHRERRVSLSLLLGVLSTAGYQVVFGDGRHVSVL